MSDEPSTSAVEHIGGAGGDPAAPASGGGSSASNDVAQKAAIEAAERAISRSDMGVGGDIAEAPGGDRGAPAPTRAERLAELVQLREENFEDFAARGMDVELAQLEGDDDADQDAGVEGDELGAEGEGGDADEEAEVAAADGDAEAEDHLEVDPDAVPETAEGYQLPVIEGLAWSDADKAGIAPWLETFHEMELPQGAAQKLLARYGDLRRGLARVDKEQTRATRAALNETWGEQTEQQLAVANEAYRTVLPKEFRQQLREARLPNGQRLVNTSEWVRLMASLAKSQPPSVDGRIAEVRKILREDRSRYDREGLGEELQQLYARKETGQTTVDTHPGHSDPDEKRMVELKRMMRSQRDAYYAGGHDVEYQRLLEKRERRKDAA